MRYFLAILSLVIIGIYFYTTTVFTMDAAEVVDTKTSLVVVKAKDVTSMTLEVSLILRPGFIVKEWHLAKSNVTPTSVNKVDESLFLYFELVPNRFDYTIAGEVCEKTIHGDENINDLKCEKFSINNLILPP